MSKIIGIPCWTEDRKGYIDHEINNNFSKMVIEAGGIPLIFPQLNNKEILDEYINMIDGIIFVGGSDISPCIYNEIPSIYLSNISPSRDEVECYLFDKAVKKKIPILGVCRGMQLMNVYFGGDLYQDIYTDLIKVINHNYKDKEEIMYFHRINIDEDSILYKLFGKSTIVNTFHHQAIKNLAKGFKITAKAPDNIIEAIEYEGDQFIMGIQFHPEFPEHNKDFHKVFDYFINIIE